MADRYEQDRADTKPVRGEKEARMFFMETLGAISVGAAFLLCFIFTLPFFYVDHLALTDDEVEVIAEPGARLFAKSKIPAETKARILSSGDYIGLGVGLTAYVYRVSTVIKEANHAGTQQTTGLSAASTPTTTATNNGTGPTGPAVAAGLAGWGNYAAG